MSEESKAVCLDATCQCKKSACCKAPAIEKEIEEEGANNEMVKVNAIVCSDCEDRFMPCACMSAEEIKKNYQENLKKIRAGKDAEEEDDDEDSE